MLSRPYRWTESPTGAYLHFNYRGVARVVADGPCYRVTIHWRDKTLTGRAASIEQGKRHIERWIEARGDLLRATRA